MSYKVAFECGLLNLTICPSNCGRVGAFVPLVMVCPLDENDDGDEGEKDYRAENVIDGRFVVHGLLTLVMG